MARPMPCALPVTSAVRWVMASPPLSFEEVGCHAAAPATRWGVPLATLR